MTKDWLQEGLLTVSNRQKWQHRRKMLTPAYHFSILKNCLTVFDQQGHVLLKNLENHVDNGAFDICNYINLYTLDVICETSMGVAIEAQSDQASKYVNSMIE